MAKSKVKQPEPVGGDEMLKRIRSCVTLAEYRDAVLAENQADIAHRAKVHQTAVSRLEKGELPSRRRYWAKYLKAYFLERWPMEFERLAKGGAA